jgi:XTP/dITP diphosphohydrolase
VRLSVITSNPGKAREYAELFEGTGIEAVHAPNPYDEVQSDRLEEVVRKGMGELRGRGLSDFIIDDSGLFIDSLKGFPGVWSAYAQKTIGNAGILRLMEGAGGRSARFRCCIGCSIGGEDLIVSGECEGVILESERGAGGFGFDPVFSSDGERSFSEIPQGEKNRVSHRAVAMAALMAELRSRSLI